MPEEIIQGSEEWHQSRLGKVTASRMADVMARTKSGYGASRSSYMAELICERLTGQRRDNFASPAMVWGTETEPQARATYAFMTDNDVVEVGLIDHPSIAMFGASPDGLVGNDGLVEIKCPTTAVHLDTLLAEAIPQKYHLQIQTQMACTGRAWCDFVSFDPRLPAELQIWIKRVVRDDAAISEIESEARKFLGELSEKLDALRSRYMQEAA